MGRSPGWTSTAPRSATFSRASFSFVSFCFAKFCRNLCTFCGFFFVRAAFLFVFAPLVLAFVALALLYFSFFLVHPIYHLRLLFSLHPIHLVIVVTQIRGHIAGSSPPLPTTVRALHFFRCIFFRKIYYKKKHVSCGLCKLRVSCGLCKLRNTSDSIVLQVYQVIYDSYDMYLIFHDFIKS